jgi:hypothetical protein
MTYLFLVDTRVAPSTAAAERARLQLELHRVEHRNNDLRRQLDLRLAALQHSRAAHQPIAAQAVRTVSRVRATVGNARSAARRRLVRRYRGLQARFGTGRFAKLFPR